MSCAFFFLATIKLKFIAVNFKMTELKSFCLVFCSVVCGGHLDLILL